MGSEPRSSEITPEHVYFNRRTFLKAGAMAATAAGTAMVYRHFNGLPEGKQAVTALPPPLPGLTPDGAATEAGSQPGAGGVAASGPADGAVPESMKAAFTTSEEKTPYQSITHYNNFYEFSTDKDGVAESVGNFSTKGWKVRVEGLVSKPMTFDMDDIRKIAPPEERVYRMRCVEAWSMVIPWAGYSLSKLLERVQPLSGAKFVAFRTLLDPNRFPGQHTNVLEWPYVEGLRMDEAMHPLALLTTGLYGRELPAQDGAPVRMIMPWKYGFKGIKSIVKITLQADQPATSWNLYAPQEYGFYANVNPNHDHPRWSQSTEQRIGETGRRATLMFNGYGEQVAGMYTGMDLDVDF